MVLLESCEKVNVSYRSARHFLLQDLALDPHETLKCLFPSIVGYSLIGRCAPCLSKEKHPRIVLAAHAQRFHLCVTNAV